MLNYPRTVADKVGENDRVMHQIRNNSSEQALLGDFPQVFDDAIIDSSDAHMNQRMQVLTNQQTHQGLLRVVFDMLINNNKL